jgi:hypothetical protein
MGDHEYVDDRNYIAYGEEGNKAVFIRRCPQCSRFVKPNKQVRISDHAGLANEPNAACGIHGAIQMPFIGFI